jgi:hypothetical protein
MQENPLYGRFRENGSGDNEDATVGCGATGEFASINLNYSQGVVSQNGGQKRKIASVV